jgi:hypothetical protein
MAYIGRSPQAGNYSKLDNIAASFNGSLTIFNLTVAGAAFTASQATQLLISVDGVLQEPETAYTVSGSNITFTSAPASGASFFGVALGDTLDIGVPSNGSVTSAKLAAGAVANTNLAAGAVTAHAVAAGAISSNTQLATGVVTRHAIAPSANVAYANISQKFTKSQYGNTYAYGTLIANTAWRPDLTQGNFVSLTLGGNITINNPSTQNAGQSGAFLITNGGSHTVSWGSDFKFASGTAPTITASGTDVVSYYIGTANNIYCDALQALS